MVASAISRNLQAPSRMTAYISGFGYQDVLRGYGISQEHWKQFTADTNEAKLSRKQWTTVIDKGFGSFAIGAMMIGFLSTVPTASVAWGSHKRHERGT